MKQFVTFGVATQLIQGKTFFAFKRNY